MIAPRWLHRLAERLAFRVMQRPPDALIGGEPGSPYMQRWYVWPRNRLLSLYVHRILRDDDARALHDHPGASVSLIVRGGYWEVLAGAIFWRPPGWIGARRATTPHRLELLRGTCGCGDVPPSGHCLGCDVDVPQPPAVTLFLFGPKWRTWGFWCPDGWRPWQEYVQPTADGNTTGRGCE